MEKELWARDHTKFPHDGYCTALNEYCTYFVDFVQVQVRRTSTALYCAVPLLRVLWHRSRPHPHPHSIHIVHFKLRSSIHHHYSIESLLSSVLQVCSHLLFRLSSAFPQSLLSDLYCVYLLYSLYRSARSSTGGTDI